MTDEEKKVRLGRGLAALLGDAGDEASAVERSKGQRLLPIGFLRPSAYNPRKSFSEDELAQLAQSIVERGLLQPLLVRGIPGERDAYEIVAGERRWRASQIAGLMEVPVVLMEVDDKQALEIAVIENVQRSDLNALEEAEGYQKLIDDFGYRQDDLSKIIGKSRSHIANTLRLLKLPDSLKHQVLDGSLSAGHARALLSAEAPEVLADQVVRDSLSVRETEAMVARLGSVKAPQPREKHADTRLVEQQLSQALGLRVELLHGAKGGKLVIRYEELDQLQDVIKRLTTPLPAKREPSIRTL